MTNRGDLTGGPEIVKINGKMYLEVVFCCAGCDYPIVKDSWDHDQSHSKDGLIWYCDNCDCPSEEDEDSEEEEEEPLCQKCTIHQSRREADGSCTDY